jgi:hypothetical protein
MVTNKQLENTGFKELLNSMMTRRWLITLIVLLTFMSTALGIMISIHMDTSVGQEWKELLLLLLGAFIGSYGKIIDYWFSDTDKDKMLVQKMDEEDGVSLSNVNSIEGSDN